MIIVSGQVKLHNAQIGQIVRISRRGRWVDIDLHEHGHIRRTRLYRGDAIEANVVIDLLEDECKH